MALKRKNFTEEARERTERARSALKAEVRRREYRQLDLEEALGRSHGYFSHLFGGRLTLTMEGVLEVLLAIGADPAEFFLSVLGPEDRGKGGSSTEEIDATVVRALRRYGYAPKGERQTRRKEPSEPTTGTIRRLSQRLSPGQLISSFCGQPQHDVVLGRWLPSQGCRVAGAPLLHEHHLPALVAQGVNCWARPAGATP